MTFKLNDTVTMRHQTHWWSKGDVGRIVKLDHNTQGEPIYLICFDTSCHQMHEYSDFHEHCYWTGKNDLKLRRQNKLMNDE